MNTTPRCTLCLLVAIACAAPAALADSHDLVAGAQAWQDAFDRGDFAGIAALYAEDARIMPPNAEAVVGRSAVEPTFREMQGLELDLETVESATSGDLGYRVGTYVLKSEGNVVDRGKFMETWREVDGRWLITNDIWNSDMPAAAEHDHPEEHDGHGEAHGGDHGHGR